MRGQIAIRRSLQTTPQFALTLSKVTPRTFKEAAFVTAHVNTRLDILLQ